MDLYDKLLEVSRAFRIEYDYLGYETIQMGNVNRTYKVNFRLPEGNAKSLWCRMSIPMPSATP